MSKQPPNPHDEALKAFRESGKSPELAAFLGWLLPGAGHLYGGQAIKGLVAMVLLTGLFGAGLFLSHWEAVSLDPETGHRLAFATQAPAGLPTGLALAVHKGWILGVDPPASPTERVRDPDYIAQLPHNDTGLLFTMIAGLLNLLLIHDALSGCPGGAMRRAEEAARRKRLDALRDELAAEQADAKTDAKTDA